MPTPPQRPANSTAPHAPNPSAADAPSLPAQGPTLPYARPSPAAGAPTLQVPGYEIQGELGRGGMGVVYLAKNVLMNRLEVLKVANRALLDRQPGAAERFLREIRAAAQLGHENVVKAYSALQVGELLVFAMEYVEGEDLDRVVRRQGPLPVAHACHYVSHAALGLQHAHEQGMVHRDIKPPNLILTRRGKKHVVKVLDFGLAKAVREGEAATDLTGAGAMMGTPAYMAPEQAQDAAVADIRADIYSLGCTLYFLLTGAPPFAGASIYAILKAHESTEATPLHQKRAGIPAELSAVAARLMAKDPARRFQKPIDVAKALAPFIKPGSVPPPEPVKPPLAKILTVELPTATAVPTAEAPKPREPAPSAPSIFNRPTMIVRRGGGPAALEKPTAGPTRPVTGNRPKNWMVVAAFTVVMLLLAGAFGLWVGGVSRVQTPVPVPLADVPLPEIDYGNPVLAVKFHDVLQPMDFLPAPRMGFGLGVSDPSDRSHFKTRLVYDEFGRTNNVCVQIGKTNPIEYLWGQDLGAWKPPIKKDLGTDLGGHPLVGAEATWVHAGDPPIAITQHVEIVPGGLSPDGKKRLLDTCLIYYDIYNDDGKTNAVGLRFLLDTYIGSNDAVPFTIAGAKDLCDTMKEFNRPEDVPDYISALEHQDLQKPGTVAHISLKYGGGLEPPTRVTLGSWPVSSLRPLPGGAKADGPQTKWDVPVLPMADAKSSENPNGDSAVTLYWDTKDIAPKKTRTVGFAYGLGSVTGEGGEGQLGLEVGGEVAASKDFSLTALVKSPAQGATLTLALPHGLELAQGQDKQSVDPVPPGSASVFSPVTWKVHAVKAGVYTIQITLNSGATLKHRLVVPEKIGNQK